MPTQQPAHVTLSHVPDGTHTPLVHVSFTPQATQATPLLPHAVGVAGLMQLVPEQQPFGQLPGLQVGVWHVRSFGSPSGAQVFPVAEQSAQAWPPLPQATLSAPMTHVLPWQHPPQFAGPHVGVPVHCPPLVAKPLQF